MYGWFSFIIYVMKVALIDNGHGYNTPGKYNFDLKTIANICTVLDRKTSRMLNLIDIL